MNYFIKNKINYLNREIDLIWYRFDRDGDGRISYSEVCCHVYNYNLLMYSLMKKSILKRNCSE